MGDGGEGLIDADSRIQERMEELERERAAPKRRASSSPEELRRREMIESLTLARIELERQLAATTHERRRRQIAQAFEEIDRRLAEMRAPIT